MNAARLYFDQTLAGMDRRWIDVLDQCSPDDPEVVGMLAAGARYGGGVASYPMLRAALDAALEREDEDEDEDETDPVLTLVHYLLETREDDFVEDIGEVTIDPLVAAVVEGLSETSDARSLRMLRTVVIAAAIDYYADHVEPLVLSWDRKRLVPKGFEGEPLFRPKLTQAGLAAVQNCAAAAVIEDPRRWRNPSEKAVDDLTEQAIADLDLPGDCEALREEVRGMIETELRITDVDEILGEQHSAERQRALEGGE